MNPGNGPVPSSVSRSRTVVPTQNISTAPAVASCKRFWMQTSEGKTLHSPHLQLLDLGKGIPNQKGTSPCSCLPTENLNFRGTQGRLEPCPGHSWHGPGARLEPGDPAPASPTSPTHPRPRAAHRAGHVLQTPQDTEPHWAMRRTKHEPGVRLPGRPSATQRTKSPF